MPRLRLVLLAALVCLLSAARAVSAQGAPRSNAAAAPLPAAAIDSLAASYVTSNRSIGVVVGVARADEPVIVRAHGKANLEWDVPMSADAMFEAGSVAKQFAAAAILQLRDAGKLSLDDPITKWIPGLETGGRVVTLRHLMTHTSGIARFTDEYDWERNMFVPGLPRDTAMALVKLTPFLFEPGEAQAYSNSGIWLLGIVVEKASGMKYEDYLATRIFQPLGMSRSMFCNALTNVPRRAHGYGFVNGVINRAPTVQYAWVFAPGAVCSTAEDLVTWLRGLHGGKVLSAESYALMTTPARLNDGSSVQYGMGIKVGTDSRGLRYISHGGTAPGFRADATWYPDAKLAIVSLMNSSAPSLSATELTQRIARATLSAQRPEMQPYTGDASRFIGTFELARGGNIQRAVLEVTATPNGLAFAVNGGRPQPLPWAGGTTFYAGETTTLTFVGGTANGPYAEVRRDDAGNHAVLRRR